MNGCRLVSTFELTIPMSSGLISCAVQQRALHSKQHKKTIANKYFRAVEKYRDENWRLCHWYSSPNAFIIMVKLKEGG
jgi:hypothetical protein